MKQLSNNIIVCLFSFLILCTLSSCIFLIMGPIVQAKARKELTEEKGAIPPDFGKDKSTLLVVKTGINSYDKYLIKNFKSYVGKYQIIESADTASSKYTDKVKFRYKFDYNDNVNTMVVYSDGSSMPLVVRRFYIYDRALSKSYSADMTSGYFSKVMKAYIENLNKKIAQ